MKKIGFVIADDCEFAPVEQFAIDAGGSVYEKYGDKIAEFDYEGAKIIAIWCGIGKVNAAGAAAALCIGERVDAIINFGLSGGIQGVRKQDIVAGTLFAEHDFDLTVFGYEIGTKPQDVSIYTPDKALFDAIIRAYPDAVQTACVTGDVFVSTKEKSDLVKRLFNAGCCDMETAAIASVCRKNSVPFAAIRSISDSADEEAPDTYREENEQKKDILLNIALASVAEFLKN